MVHTLATTPFGKALQGVPLKLMVCRALKIGCHATSLSITGNSAFAGASARSSLPRNEE
jgi:hypothetical protein